MEISVLDRRESADLRKSAIKGSEAVRGLEMRGVTLTYLGLFSMLVGLSLSCGCPGGGELGAVGCDPAATEVPAASSCRKKAGEQLESDVPGEAFMMLLYISLFSTAGKTGLANL